jgi:adenosylmethionine-8-amino-7-oxononanoate aminotransferase
MEQILKMSQYQLLQTASPDAIVRLQSTSLARESETLQKIYFGKQAHGSIEFFLKFHLKYNRESHSAGLLLQVFNFAGW